MNSRIVQGAVLAAALGAMIASATAKVTPQEAARLKAELTPMGAQRAGSADGSIPPWSGGVGKAPACFAGPGSRYCDPFPEDKPLFTIDAVNAEQYRARLSAAQLEMFKRYPRYVMNVYPTRRTYAAPGFVYEATYRNALNADLGGNGESLRNAVIGAPFPVPKNGQEVIWNHKLRYRGNSVQRWNNQFAVTTSGDYAQVRMREDVNYTYSHPDATPDSLNNVGLYFLQIVTAPARLAGTLTLVHETMDQIKEPRRAWQYNPGQRRVRRAPNIGYDNPGTASDGLRTNDQYDMFNGATDRYSWKLVGKQELYAPYNSYRLHGAGVRYEDLMRKGHINQQLPRYELHRVWVIDAVTKPGTTHMYKHRMFYVDEDSWQIVVAEAWDRRDQLWRWQEAHTVLAYDRPYLLPVGEVIYDLQNGRYLAMSFNNTDPEAVERPFAVEYFNPANVSQQVTK